MKAIRQVAQLAGLILPLAIFVVVPLGEADARDWKPSDGMCPGTYDYATKTCKRPYLCEPGGCMFCDRGIGNKCTLCVVHPWCVGGKRGVIKGIDPDPGMPIGKLKIKPAPEKPSASAPVTPSPAAPKPCKPPRILYKNGITCGCPSGLKGANCDELDIR